MLRYFTLLILIPFFSNGQSDGSDERRLYNIVIEKGETVNSFDIEYEVYLSRKKQRDEYFRTASLDTFLMILMKDLDAQEMDKNDLLVYIHGMWGGSRYMFNHSMKLMHEAYVDHPESNIARIISIKWPGNTSEYKTNKSVAIALAPRLKRIADKMIRSIQVVDYFDYKKDIRINLLAHSLGNELFKEVLSYMEEEEYKHAYFDEIILAAPDLDNQLFEKGGSFSNLHLIGERVHIYFSRKDLTLNVSEALNKTDRMGVSGPSKDSLVEDNVFFIDVSDIKDEKNLRDRITGHSYYRISALATSDMRMNLVGYPVNVIQGRQLLDDHLNVFKLSEDNLTP